MDQIKNIVVVDDDENICKAIFRNLRSESMHVSYYTDPCLALSELEYKPFDVLITDYMMPKLNGLDLLKKISKTHPNTVAILLTGSGDFNVAVNAVNDKSIFKMIIKPFDNAELESIINEAYYKAVDQRMFEKFKHWSFKALGSTEPDDVVKQLHDNTLDGLMHLMRAKDLELYEHSVRISQLSIQFAKYIGYDDNDLSNLYEAALFHDIGKLAIKDQILDKPDKLDFYEYEQIKKHPNVGAELLKKLGLSTQVQLYILQHHEHVDGTGYPYGLRSHEIELAAKIIAIADAYDALRSKRTYKSALSHGDVIGILNEKAESYFDKELLIQFARMLGEIDKSNLISS